MIRKVLAIIILFAFVVIITWQFTYNHERAHVKTAEYLEFNGSINTESSPFGGRTVLIGKYPSVDFKIAALQADAFNESIASLGMLLIACTFIICVPLYIKCIKDLED